MIMKPLTIWAMAFCLFSFWPVCAQAFYNPQTGHWLSRDPIEEQGGFNLYGFASNDGINFWDDFGLRKDSGGFDVKGTGHHIIPVELWEEFGFPEEAKNIFDKATIDVKSYLDQNGLKWQHNGTAHGSESGYTAYVRDEISKILRQSGKAGKSLSVKEYVHLAQEITGEVENSSQPFIRGFLANVSDPKQLAKWNQTIGSKLPKPAGSIVVRFSGIRKINIPKGIKCGRKVPIVKYVMLVGVTLLWEADYNNARADGHNPAAAGAIATAKAADPGIEAAWDFGWGVGSYITPFNDE